MFGLSWEYYTILFQKITLKCHTNYKCNNSIEILGEENIENIFLTCHEENVEILETLGTHALFIFYDVAKFFLCIFLVGLRIDTSIPNVDKNHFFTFVNYFLTVTDRNFVYDMIFQPLFSFLII